MFLLALGVNTKISAQIPDPKNPKETIRKTCAKLLEEKKSPYWTEYFHESTQKFRRWAITDYVKSNDLTDCIYYVVDMIVNFSDTHVKCVRYTPFKHILHKALHETGEHTNIYQYLQLCVDAGYTFPERDYGFVMGFDEKFLLLFMGNESLSKFVFSKRVISKRMIEHIRSLLMHQIFEPNSTDGDIQRLQWLLNLVPACVHSDPTKTSDYSIWAKPLQIMYGIERKDPSHPQMRKVESVIQVLLTAGADPHENMEHPLDLIRRAVPIHVLLRAAARTTNEEKVSFIVRLLEMCNRSKFNREVYEQLAGSIDFLESFTFFKHMMEVGIDPLMEWRYGTPFENALSLADVEKRVEYCSIMLPYCGKRLTDREIPFCSPKDFEENFEFYMKLINAGMTCKAWAYGLVAYWLKKPQLLKRLVESNQIEPPKG
jgi:hypothetical protein